MAPHVLCIGYPLNEQEAAADCWKAYHIAFEYVETIGDAVPMLPHKDYICVIICTDVILQNELSALRHVCTGGRIVLLLASETGFLQLHAAIDELRRALHRTLSLTASAGISKEHTPSDDLHEAYKEAMEALRIAEKERGICSADGMGGMDQLCGRVLQIIEKEYMDEGLTLQSVSDRLHVSASYLGPNIKKNAGDTFINLLIHKRMSVAANLLESSDSRIAEIARRCGYPDQSYFGYCFKKFYGVSPAKMRQERERKGAHA